MALEDGFRIADREVRPVEGTICGPAGEARVEPKVMAVLVELARHAGQVVAREQIHDKVWPRRVVTDDVLTRCISQLRKALGDDGKTAELLETVPRRGYRLRADIVPLERRARLRETAQQGPEALIVLPFQNFSAAVDDFLADGLTELLISRLAALKGVRVISRTTAMRFRSRPASIQEVASEIGARWVVEGSVMRSGDRVQVVAQLIDGRTDAHVWADDYLRDLGDLLVLQNDIVERIAAAIRARLGVPLHPRGVAQSIPPEAMRAFLRGRQLLARRTVPDLRQARSELDSVSRAAPDFALAWASRAEVEMLLAHYGAEPPASSIGACREHLDRALSLEPDLALGLACRGALRFFFECDLPGAEQDLRKALTRTPSSALPMVSMANVCAVRHRPGEAMEWIGEALLVDPLDAGINMNRGDHLILQRRYDEAVEALKLALQIVPGHRGSQLRLAWALALAGRSAEARDALARPSDEADAAWHEYAALVAGSCGEQAGAASHYQALRDIAARGYVSSWALARAAAAAGARDDAVALLRRARIERCSSMPFLLVTPAFESLLEDPAVLEISRELGLAAG